MKRPAKIALVFRGYAEARLVFEERAEIEETELENVLPALAERHGKALACHELHMIEIEFLNEPDPMQRFLRFGTDPAGMVAPIRIDL